MIGDCHIHMILDGVYYRTAMDRHKNAPDEALIRQRLADYAQRGVTYLRDGGDRWGVGLLASQLAGEYGIRYRTPMFNICRQGHYGCFLGRGFSDFTEYRALVDEVKAKGGHFVKIMASGLMDFDRFGVITDTACSYALCRDMISYAHDCGFSVMAHANGPEAVTNALLAGVDSIEHGAYLNQQTLQLLAESNAVWVPTLVTVGNLIGKGRFPDEVLKPLLQQFMENATYASKLGAKIALGTDAGACSVYHGQAVGEEYDLLCQCLGEQAYAILQSDQQEIQNRF